MISKLRVLPAILLSAACGPEAPPDDGIYVGNPPGALAVAGPSNARGSAELTLFALGASNITRCNGEQLALEILDNDPLGLASLPAGRWCALDVTPDGPVVFEGAYDEVTFELTIGVEVISVSGELLLERDDENRRFMMELGESNAFADRLSFADPGTHVVLDTRDCPGEELCEALIDAVQGGSALFEDKNLDGVLSDRERSSFEVMRGTERSG